LPASVVEVVVVVVVVVTVIVVVVVGTVGEGKEIVVDVVVEVAGSVVGVPGSVVVTAGARAATNRSRPRRRAVIVPVSCSHAVSIRPRSRTLRSVPQVFQRAITSVPRRVAFTRPRIGVQMGSIDTLRP
jgi:hypothetical protein